MRLLLFILAAGFGWCETAYFGWKLLPASPQELICDGITLVLTSIALAAPPSWTAVQKTKPNA